MAKTETVDLALVMLDESKAAKGAPRTFSFGEVREAFTDAHNLTVIQARLRKINENECNGYRNETAARLDARRFERAKSEVDEIAKRYGLAFHFNGDPRGSALKLKTPHTGRYNGFGGREDGWGV